MRDPLVSYLRRLGPAQEAEDRFGEVVLRALAAPPSPSVTNRAGWLYGIARRVGYPASRDLPIPQNFPLPAQQEAEAEDSELRQALVSALSRLDEPQRELLLRRDLEGVPLAELSAGLGIETTVLAARLHRLRQSVIERLTSSEREILRARGAPVPDTRKTEIWCPRCGGAKVRASLPGLSAPVAFRCPNCSEDALFLAEGSIAAIFQGSPAVAFRRFVGLHERFWRRWSGRRHVECPVCGASGSIETAGADNRVSGRCSACGLSASANVWQLAFCNSAGQRFWRSQRRIRFETAGNDVRLISLTSQEILRFDRCPKSGCPRHPVAG